MSPITQSSTKSITKPIRWGIIGCGDVCEVKSGPAFSKCENSVLVAVMRRNSEKVQDYARRHQVPKCYTDVDSIISDEDVDCLYVATPPGGDRIEIASKVAKAGKPCYMEKPLGRDYQESLEIVNSFKQAGIPLYVAFYRRYMPKFVTVKKEVIDCDLIGDITGVSIDLNWPRHLENKSHWHYKKEISGGGLLLDVGCHMLDIVDHLVGPIVDCQGIAMQSIRDQGFEEGDKIEDNVRGFWQHEMGNGRMIGGSCTFNFCSGGQSKDEVKIVGTKGTVLFSCFDSDPARVMLDDNDEIRILEAPHPNHVHQPLVQRIVDELIHIRGKDSEGKFWSKNISSNGNHCACTGITGSRTSKVMDLLLNNRQSWNDDYL